MANNFALYYPTIEFRNYEWLWSASLLWDRIYRIVPTGYQPEDSDNIRILADSGEIGIPIRPNDYAADVAREFIEKMESGKWTAAAVGGEIPAEYARLHQDKVDVRLRQLIISKGSAAAHEGWLYVPTEFEALYMTFLANRIASANNLQLLSDTAAAWTGSTYFKYDGGVQDYPNSEFPQQLATLVVRDFIPQNILSIAPKDILTFRMKYRDERQRFIQAIKTGAENLAKCEDPAVIRDHIEDLKREIEAALKDYKKSMQVLNIVGWTGIKSVSFPVVTKIAAEISGKELDPSTLMVVSALGIGLGLVSGLAEWQEKSKRLSKECDYSYLLHLQREWKAHALYNRDYNYFLCRQMEEFIND